MTLDEHRDRYAANIVWKRTGKGEEPLWDVADLTDQEMRVFGQRVRAAWIDPQLRELGYNQAQVYKAVLDAHGLACPHPKPFRTPDGTGGFSCLACVPFSAAQNEDNDGSWGYEPGRLLTDAQKEQLRTQIIQNAIKTWGGKT